MSDTATEGVAMQAAAEVKWCVGSDVTAAAAWYLKHTWQRTAGLCMIPMDVSCM